MQLFFGILLCIIAVVGLCLPRKIEIKLLMFGQQWKFRDKNVYSNTYFIFLKFIDILILALGAFLIFSYYKGIILL